MGNEESTGHVAADPASGRVLEVIHDRDRHRFVLEIAPERTGFLDYRPIADGKVWDLTYTYVPRQDRHTGTGRALVRHVLELARRKGIKVVPSCGFVATVIEESREYRDLLAT